MIGSGSAQEKNPLVEQEDRGATSTILAQTFDNLDFIWGIGIQRSEEYARIHNTYVNAHTQIPSLEIFPIVIKYSDQCVTFDAEQQDLIPLETCEATEDELSALAKQSYEGTQTMLARYYHDQFFNKANKLKAALEDAVKNDSDTVFAEFISRIEKIIQQADRMNTDPLFVNIVEIIKTKTVLEEAEYLLQFGRELTQQFKNDLTFAPGESELSEMGKSMVATFLERFIAINAGFPQQYPGQTIIVTIKTTGYADEQPFDKATALKLLEEIAANVPIEPVEQRKFFHQQLSERRAATINQYAQELLQQHDWGDSKIQIESLIEGKGEEFPTLANISPPYRDHDPRRRISKISAIFRRVIPLPLFVVNYTTE